MSLLNLWQTARVSVEDKHVQQIISFAGDGRLSDGSKASDEFRTYLSHIPSSLLERYANECLAATFELRGFVLQDIVNQIGRRLSFDINDGLYRGRQGSIGYDGIWHLHNNGDIVVEVKTTDAYQIDLKTIVKYRDSLLSSNQIVPDSSILIVVGNQDTDSLEAQVRGSKYAWDIRLISVDALVKLLKLKEKIEDVNISQKIWNILTPQEYTKVDGIIDLAFSTAEEIDLTIDVQNDEVDEKTSSQVTEVIDDLKDKSIFKISKKLGISLVRQSRSTYSGLEQKITISCAISREYIQNNQAYYWFGFHPAQKQFLEQSTSGYATFVCGSDNFVFLFPLDMLDSWLPGLNQTKKTNRSYWHIHITQAGNKWWLKRKTGYKEVDITSYMI